MSIPTHLLQSLHINDVIVMHDNVDRVFVNVAKWRYAHCALSIDCFGYRNTRNLVLYWICFVCKSIWIHTNYVRLMTPALDSWLGIGVDGDV